MRNSRIIFYFFIVLLLPNTVTAADFFVSPTGDDGNNCSKAAPCRHVGAAVGKITAGLKATVKIADGTYVEEDMGVQTATTITLEGGWDTDFSEQICRPTGTTIVAGNRYNHWPTQFFIINPDDKDSKTSLTIRCLTLDGTPSFALGGAVEIYTNNNAQIGLTMQHTRVTGFKAYGIHSETHADDPGTISLNIADTVFDHNFSQGTADNANLISVNSNKKGMTQLQLNRVSLINNGSTSAHSIIVDLFNQDSGSLSAQFKNTIIAGNQTAQTNDSPTLSIASRSTGASSLHLINSTISDNLITESHGALEVFSNESAAVTIALENTIVQGNHFPSQSGHTLSLHQADGSTLSFTADYSILGTHSTSGTVTYTSSHEVHGAPLLNSTYHLQQGSAAIDAGICGEWKQNGNFWLYNRIAPYDDIDGDKRPGFGQLLGCDIGADEYRSFPWPMFLPAITHKRFNPYTFPTRPTF